MSPGVIHALARPPLRSRRRARGRRDLAAAGGARGAAQSRRAAQHQPRPARPVQRDPADRGHLAGARRRTSRAAPPSRTATTRWSCTPRRASRRRSGSRPGRTGPPTRWCARSMRPLLPRGPGLDWSCGSCGFAGRTPEIEVTGAGLGALAGRAPAGLAGAARPGQRRQRGHRRGDRRDVRASTPSCGAGGDGSVGRRPGPLLDRSARARPPRHGCCWRRTRPGWVEMLELLDSEPDRPVIVDFNSRTADGRDPSLALGRAVRAAAGSAGLRDGRAPGGRGRAARLRRRAARAAWRAPRRPQPPRLKGWSTSWPTTPPSATCWSAPGSGRRARLRRDAGVTGATRERIGDPHRAGLPGAARDLRRRRQRPGARDRGCAGAGCRPRWCRCPPGSRCRPSATSTCSAAAKTSRRCSPPTACAQCQSLRRAVEAGAMVFAVCAGFQIVGQRFPGQTASSTTASDCCRSRPGAVLRRADEPVPPRAVGDIVVEPDPEFGLPPLLGYENHGGRTRPVAGAPGKPLGVVRQGHRQRHPGQGGRAGPIGARVSPPTCTARCWPRTRRSPTCCCAGFTRTCRELDGSRRGGACCAGRGCGRSTSEPVGAGQVSTISGHRPVVDQATCMSAPKTPGLHGALRARAVASTTWSTSGSATGPGAAAFHDGRRPLRVSA